MNAADNTHEQMIALLAIAEDVVTDWGHVCELTVGFGPDACSCSMSRLRAFLVLAATVPAPDEALAKEVIELLGARLDQMRADSPPATDVESRGFDDGWNSARLQISANILNPRIAAHIRANMPAPTLSTPPTVAPSDLPVATEFAVSEGECDGSHYCPAFEHARNCPTGIRTSCNCRSLGGRFGAHRPECPASPFYALTPNVQVTP